MRKYIGFLLAMCMFLVMLTPTAFASESPSNESYNINSISATLNNFIEEQGVLLNSNSLIAVEEKICDKDGESVIICNVKIINEEDGDGRADILSCLIKSSDIQDSAYKQQNGTRSSTGVDFIDCSYCVVHATAYYNVYTDYSISRSYRQPYQVSFYYTLKKTASISYVAASYDTCGEVFNIGTLTDAGFFDSHTIFKGKSYPAAGTSYSTYDPYTSGAFLTYEGLGSNSIYVTVTCNGVVYGSNIGL